MTIDVEIKPSHLEIRAMVEIFSNIKSLINIARAVDMDYTFFGSARMVINL